MFFYKLSASETISLLPLSPLPLFPKEALMSSTHIHVQSVDQVLAPVDPDLPVAQGHDDPLQPLSLVVNHLHQSDGSWQLVHPKTLALKLYAEETLISTSKTDQPHLCAQLPTMIHSLVSP